VAVWWRVTERLRFASMTLIKPTKVDELVPYLIFYKILLLNVKIKSHLVLYKYRLLLFLSCLLFVLKKLSLNLQAFRYMLIFI
jgi:hypothetical protein